MNSGRTLSSALRRSLQNSNSSNSSTWVTFTSGKLYYLHQKVRSTINHNCLYSSWIRNTFAPVTWMTGGVNNGENGGRSKGRGRKVGESTILLQEGLDIQEVPVAILRSDPRNTNDEVLNGQESARSYVTLDPQEEAAFVDGFKSYHTPQEILKILDTIPSQEVTPFVSLSILRKLFELENNFGFRNEGKSWIISTTHSQIETFARTAIVSRLIDTIISANDPAVLLDALDILRFERHNDNQSFPYQSTNWGGYSSSDELENYRNKLFEEVLIRVTEGKFGLEQVCHAVVSLGKMELERGFKFSSDLIDKLWVGIIEKHSDINANNLVEVCRTVPYFKKSRRLVMNLVEKKVVGLWWRMDTKMVSELCSILLMKDSKASHALKVTRDALGVSKRFLVTLSKCTSVNIHQIKEDELLTIVEAFYVFNFYHPTIEKALNKYMKAKCLKISNPTLVAVVMDYAKKFHIRSPHILEGGAEYMILHNGTTLSAPEFSSVLMPFGYLDYQPPNGFKFWEIVEKTLDERFIQFQPKCIVDILLSCVYISKFPLNFTDKVFSPYFLDRLHTSETDYNVLQQVRSRLKLLDTALTIECGRKYNGPLLPKDFTARKIFVDGRVSRMISVLQTYFENACQDLVNVEYSVVLPNMPLNELYILDIVLSPKDSILTNILKNRINLRSNTGRRTNLVSSDDDEASCSKDLIAVLINIPEHFSSDGNHLIGPQAMRVRHLKALGFSVANLKYETLSELRLQPDAFNDYLKENLKLAGLSIEYSE